VQRELGARDKQVCARLAGCGSARRRSRGALDRQFGATLPRAAHFLEECLLSGSFPAAWLIAMPLARSSRSCGHCRWLPQSSSSGISQDGAVRAGRVVVALAAAPRHCPGEVPHSVGPPLQTSGHTFMLQSTCKRVPQCSSCPGGLTAGSSGRTHPQQNARRAQQTSLRAPR
jgi:hypothetical protein